jgi:hypothetical protein
MASARGRNTVRYSNGDLSAAAVLESKEGRGRQGDLARLAALASTHSELAIDQVQVGKIDDDRLGAAQPAALARKRAIDRMRRRTLLDPA